MKCAIAALAVFLVCTSPARSAPTTTKLVRDGAKFRIERAGKPFLVKGAGGGGPIAKLAALGANAIRTWSTENIDSVLEEASKHGLTVAVGFWLGHERHGFKYSSVDQVAEQRDRIRDTIARLKDHPAVLVWVFGNEMEADGENAAVWLAVDSLAAMAKAMDPNHPTMTVIAEVGGAKVRNLHRLCPNVDVVGLNSYGGAPSIPDRYVKAGGEKPYMLTEFGPLGTWEVAKTPWGRPVEPTSTAKAAHYRESYEKAVLNQPLCVGSFAFTWGHKQEATATWFGMLLKDGNAVGAAETMGELWSGARPANRCPIVKEVRLDGTPDADPSASVRAVLSVSDPDNDALTAEWALHQEPDAYGFGGDAEAAPPVAAGAVTQSDLKGATVKLPADPGAYRLYVTVRDGKGNAATANLPLLVKGVPKIRPAPSAKLPLVVYGDAGDAAPPFTPAGWMGNQAAMKMDTAWKDSPKSGATCIRCDYNAGDGWGGVVWQSPENDWGDLPGGWDLRGAKRVTFWARGAKGGEVVSFELGLLGKDKKYPDSAQAKLADVPLTSEWKQYTIDLAGKDLSRIKTGFNWVVAGKGAPVTFFLDGIQYE